VNVLGFGFGFEKKDFFRWSYSIQIARKPVDLIFW
jgi:hypothetical protein